MAVSSCCRCGCWTRLLELHAQVRRSLQMLERVLGEIEKIQLPVPSR